MPLRTKPTSPNAGARGFGAALRLIAREPHLADAARVEARLATLYGQIADLRPEPPEGPRWRQAAHLSRAIADSLATLAEAAGRPRHHPRPTRIRVATLRAADLEKTVARVESLCGTLPAANGTASPGPCTVALSELVGQEGRAVLLPLVRIIAVAPTSGLFALWQQAAARRRVLRSLGVEGGRNEWPDPPRRPGAGRRARSGHGTQGEAPPPRSGTWSTTGRVERVHPARRAGTARTEEGQTVFFCARVVAGGLAELRPGDTVRLKLRRGPLGVMAVGVEPCPPSAPGPRSGRKNGPKGPSAET